MENRGGFKEDFSHSVIEGWRTERTDGDLDGTGARMRQNFESQVQQNAMGQIMKEFGSKDNAVTAFANARAAGDISKSKEIAQLLEHADGNMSKLTDDMATADATARAENIAKQMGFNKAMGGLAGVELAGALEANQKAGGIDQFRTARAAWGYSDSDSDTREFAKALNSGQMTERMADKANEFYHTDQFKAGMSTDVVHAIGSEGLGYFDGRQGSRRLRTIREKRRCRRFWRRRSWHRELGEI